jgi:hypothetical protein
VTTIASHKTMDRPDTGASSTRASSLLVSAVTVVVLLLLFCIAVRLMNYELRRDEELYVPPVRLLENYELYRDFFYNHSPGSAWLFYGIGQLTGSDYIVLSARLGVFAGWLLLVGSIGGVSLALTRSILVGACIVVLTLVNELFLTQTGMTATNNLLPLPFSFLGLGLFILGVDKGYARPGLIALAGFCLSIGVALKVSAVAFIPPVAVAAFCLPRHVGIRARLRQVVAPLLVGGLLGGLPIIAYLVRDPALFLAHVLGYHLGPHAQYFALLPEASGERSVITFPAKLMMAYDVWLGGALIVSLSALLTLVLMARRWSADSGRPIRLLPSAPMAIVLAALALSVAFSFVPTPSYPQYFAPPLVCLPLAIALLFARLLPDARAKALPALVAASVVVLVVGAPRLLQHAGTVLRPQQWTVMRVHASGIEMAQLLAAADVQGKVATLSPIYPLEGRLQVYPELATGPFAYRAANLTAPELARYYRMTSPTEIGSLLEADPPAALLLGFYPVLEEPMLAYANSHGYVPMPDFSITDRYGTGVLYVNPRRLD